MPIRIRIATATAVLMMISLLILGTGVYLTMSRNLNGDLEQRLRSVYSRYQSGNSIIVDPRGSTEQLIDPDPLATSGTLVQVTDPNGTVIDTSPNLGDEEIDLPPEVRAANANLESRLYSTTIQGLSVRVLSGYLILSTGEIRYVQIGELTRPIDSTLAELRQNLIVGSVLATIILTLGAWLIGDASLRPLATMSNTARSIGSTRDLSQRLDPPSTNDEVQYLAETFNDMLARLEETFSAQRRFVADASHELRTPLTALRANSDIMLRQIESGMIDRDDLTEGLTDVRDEVDRMTRMVLNLLTLARADVGWRPEMEAVDLADTVRDAARIAMPLSRGQQLDVSAPLADGIDERIDVYGNEDQLKQLVLILLDNAFIYTPAETTVTLTLTRIASDAVITVSDTGPGISAEHVQNIFERFYRADSSRTRSSGGSGLGLAIARWVVAVHGGTIDASSAEGVGTTFTIRLPIVEQEASRSGFLRRGKPESALAPS
jgi:two-component system, OmpR family, sensor kinase